MDYKNYNDYEIMYRIRESDEEAVNIMFAKYEPLIKNLANKHYEQAKMHGADINDLIQEGRIALNRALSSYKDDSGVTFYTYAVVCIQRHFVTYCRNISNSRHFNLNNNVGDEALYVIGDSKMDPEVLSFDKYYDELFIEYKNIFNFRESNIFELRYNGFSYREISLLLDIPIWIVDSNLRKIRKILHVKRTNFN